jgi:hypothetical protein
VHLGKSGPFISAVGRSRSVRPRLHASANPVVAVRMLTLEVYNMQPVTDWKQNLAARRRERDQH